MSTLNELIRQSISGAGEAEKASPVTVDPVRADTAPPAKTSDEDAEKLASVLEFIGRRGVGSFFDKEAMHASDPPPGTNAGQTHRTHTQKQVAPHKGAPPMAEPSFGRIPNNDKDKPGGGKSVDTTGKEHGTHHAALASNAAAIAFDKKVKAKKVAPALSAILDSSAFSDGKLKENLRHTSGDKNINKTASEGDAQRFLVEEELRRRGIAAQGA
jgi:hypothetical protein